MKNVWLNCLGLVGLVALSINSSAFAQEIVNYGVQPTMAPIYIAQAMGLLGPIEKKYNVKIIFRRFQDGPVENQAMAAGALQIASAGMGPAVIAVARLPATLIAITVLNENAILVPKDSPIKSVAGLKGKTVAFPGIGAQQYPMLIKALGDVGLKETDIKLFKTDGSQIPTLLQQKSVDAGITYDPYVSSAVIGGHSRVLLTADQIMPIKQGHYIGNGEYVRNDFLKRRPEVVQALMNVNVRAIEFILKNPAAAAKMWTKEMGIPENVALFSLTKGIAVYSRDIIPYKSSIDAYVKFLREGHILEATDTPKIDVSFAQKALASD